MYSRARLSRLFYENLFFVIVLAFFTLLACVRSSPVFGKLDFLFVDNMPWWPRWELLINEALAGDQQAPLLTDPITATVFNGVYDQQTVYFRQFRPRRFINIRKVDRKNRFFGSKIEPLYPLLLTRGGDSRAVVPEVESPFEVSENELGESGIVIGTSALKPRKRPYRCLINLRGFDQTWVPAETLHWLPVLSNTALWYHYDGKRGKALKKLLAETPLENCAVYY